MMQVAEKREAWVGHCWIEPAGVKKSYYSTESAASVPVHPAFTDGVTLPNQWVILLLLVATMDPSVGL